MSHIRKLPAVDSRVETGAVQFGDDWPGVFIRGDEAFGLVAAIDTLLSDSSAPFAAMMVQGLRDTLAECDLTGLSKRGEGAPT